MLQRSHWLASLPLPKPKVVYETLQSSFLSLLGSLSLLVHTCVYIYTHCSIIYCVCVLGCQSNGTTGRTQEGYFDRQCSGLEEVQALSYYLLYLPGKLVQLWDEKIITLPFYMYVVTAEITYTLSKYIQLPYHVASTGHTHLHMTNMVAREPLHMYSSLLQYAITKTKLSSQTVHSN